eukprot:gene223-426_t
MAHVFLDQLNELLDEDHLLEPDHTAELLDVLVVARKGEAADVMAARRHAGDRVAHAYHKLYKENSQLLCTTVDDSIGVNLEDANVHGLNNNGSWMEKSWVYVVIDYQH